MTAPADTARYRANLQDEVDSAFLYRAFAAAETQPQIAEVFRRLAAVEEKHAGFWREALQAAGAPVPDLRPGWRPRVLARIARWFGVGLVLPTVATQETGGAHATAGSRRPARPRCRARSSRTTASSARF